MRSLDALTRTLGPAVEAGWDQVGEETCRTCNGEGGYEVVVGGWDEPIYEGRECEDCAGTGRAPVGVFFIRPAEPLVDAPKPQPIPLGGDHHDDPALPF